MRRRFISAVLLIGALAPGLWWRSPDPDQRYGQALTVTPLPLPTGCCAAAFVRVDGAWHLTGSKRGIGGYSGLVVGIDGSLTAFSDSGNFIVIATPQATKTRPIRFGEVQLGGGQRKGSRDVEAATNDTQSGQVWLALEGRGLVVKLTRDLKTERSIAIRAMRNWPGNQGPEAMTRLRDGRFIVLSEAYDGWFERSHHAGLLFEGDPVSGLTPQRFTFRGAFNYRPTDMAQLPDGRILVLMRELRWPFPPRFGIRLMMLDPGQIQAGEVVQPTDLGELPLDAPVDNYEGLALIPEHDGTVTGWLISDDNAAALQRTLLLRLRIDPARLPNP